MTKKYTYDDVYNASLKDFKKKTNFNLIIFSKEIFLEEQNNV